MSAADGKATGANERLHAAILHAGIDLDDLAIQAHVDTKTVSRWLGGRIPHARVRFKVAQILGVEPDTIWPDTTPTARPRDDRRELAGIWAHANDIRAPDWKTLLSQAREQIDLLATTLHPIITAAGTTDLLREKADQGARVRVLIAHPESIWLAALAQLHGYPRDDHGRSTIDLQLLEVRERLQQFAGLPRIEIREHWAPCTTSLFRFDGHLLARLHLHVQPGDASPLIHLQQRDPDGPFQQLADYLDQLWIHASERFQPDPGRVDDPGP